MASVPAEALALVSGGKLIHRLTRIITIPLSLQSIPSSFEASVISARNILTPTTATAPATQNSMPAQLNSPATIPVVVVVVGGDGDVHLQ